MTIKATAQITLSVVIDVKATYRYYLLQSSTLDKPTKPTAFPPASNWGDVEPTYTDGSTNSLYFVDCTVFCDDTFSYSEVSLSSSYEAAKTAYNKAVNAQQSAQNANDKVDNIAVGGRNLIRSSTNLQYADYYFSSGKALNAETTVSGEVVTISDATPKEHDLKVTVSGVDDPTAVTVYRYGKNLIDYTKSTDRDGKALTILEDGVEWGTLISYYFYIPCVIPAGIPVVFSCDSTHPENPDIIDAITVFYEDGTSGYFSSGKQDFVSFTPSKQVSKICPRKGNTSTVETTPIKITNIQLEVGTEQTEYEKPAEQSVTADANGNVYGLTSLYPYMTLFTDTADTTLEVTYNRVAALEAVTDTSPEGKTEEMALFTIEELPEAFILPDIKTVGREYTLSLWIKSDAAGSLTVNDTTIPATTEWTKQAVTFTADSIDLSLIFDVLGTYYIYHPQLEEGNKATAWNLAPEDVEEAFTEDLNQVKATVERNFADLTVQSDGIMAEVSKTQENIDTVKEQITTVDQKADGISIQVQGILDNGVDKIKTGMGYTFDDEGVHIQREGAELSSHIDHEGMEVKRSEDVVLQATAEGVKAIDITVKNYLVVGPHARFEQYTDGTDSKRTACFHLEGD